MRSNSRLRGAAMAFALLIPSGVLPASADGFRGGPGGGPPPPSVSRPVIGVGAYAPGEGPVGASGWYGGNWHGPQSPVGVWGGGYYGGGGGDGGETVVRGGGANVTTYNHFDNRRRDGGVYGGAGVFYGDDGYSRATPAPEPYAGRDPRENPHIIHLPGAPAHAARGKAAREARQ